jgi:hypothetical protein
MGRKRHNWDPALSSREPDGTLTSRCKNCGMSQRDGYYSASGRVYSVLQWATPAGRLLAIRPIVDLYPPKKAPPLEGAFPGIPVSGMPECPKTPDGWADAPTTGVARNGACEGLLRCGGLGKT